jgi:hypothetical protein
MIKDKFIDTFATDISEDEIGDYIEGVGSN